MTELKQTGRTTSQTNGRVTQNGNHVVEYKRNDSSISQDVIIKEPKSETEYTSLFVFGPNNCFRKVAIRICYSKCFEYFILAVILVNCILMAINVQLPQNDMSNFNLLMEKMETGLLAVFGVEMVLNILSKGFILHRGSYLRSPWNILDFVVVVTGVLSLKELKLPLDAGAIRALRAMRVLRPLKLVSGVPSLQVVMSSIAKSVIPLGNVCLLVVFVILIYAVIGLQMLSGKFRMTCIHAVNGTVLEEGRLCADATTKSGRQCPTDYSCVAHGSGPNDGITSFDNILLSALTIFQCITQEGWTDVMYWTFDVADVHRIGFWIFYYTLNIVGSQFMLNLVLGVLSGEFGKEGEKRKRREEFLQRMFEKNKNEQKDEVRQDVTEAIETEQLEGELRNRKRGRDMSKEEVNEVKEKKKKLFHLKLRRFVKSPPFFWFIIVCVSLNSITIATEHYNQPSYFDTVQQIFSSFFMLVFLLEMCLKMLAFGFRGYFKSSFNTFDAAIVVFGIVEIILFYTYELQFGISVLRSLKLLRLFKFTRYWVGLKNLIEALLSSIKAILSLLLLLTIFLIIFALLGMVLFGGRFQGMSPEPPRVHFDDFWNSFLAVFQVLTGEDWNAVMYTGI